MIINYLLIAFGTFSIYFGIHFYLLRKNGNNICGYITLLGICSSLWCYGYALMGLTDDLAMAPIYRKIALLGASGFMCAEALMFAYKGGVSKKIRNIMGGIFSIFVLGDVFIWGASNVRRFYRVDNRTLYVNGESNGYYYQLIFMSIMFVTILALFIKWHHNTIFKRDKRFIILMYATNIFICFGTLPDTILPMLGMESFPSSPLGGFSTLCAMVFVASKYIRYDISIESLCNYAYEHEDTGFMAFNTNGRLCVANPYTRKELYIQSIDNQRLSDLFEVRDLYDKDIINEVLEKGEGEWQFDGKLNGKSYALNFSLAKYDDGEPYCIICTIYDRSKEKELIEQIINSGETKSSFLANMSHEIRTPINAILGMNEMILREATDEKVIDYAKSMDKAGGQLLGIVNDILDYSKIQSNMMDLVTVDYDLSELITEIVINYRQKASRKGLDFVVDVDPTIPIYLNGDEVRIAQILNNILQNAIKYTEKGKIEIKIEKTDISEEEVGIIFTISDTGKGIKDEEQKTLFDAFMRADHQVNQTIAGTGLGLAIVGSLVKMMGGEVQAISQYGKGSTFRVFISQRINSYHQIGDFNKVLEEYEVLNEKGWSSDFTAPAARILVVDDNHVNLNVAKYLLKRTKITVDTAASGQEAIELIKKNSYQLIFLDHIMPGMDGIETLKAIKEERLCEDVAIISLTANDVAGAREMYTDYGFADFLAKPVSGGSLEKKVYDWLPKSYIHENDNELGENIEEKEKLRLAIDKYLDRDAMAELNESIENGREVRRDKELTHIFIINPEVVGNQQMKQIRKELSYLTDLRYFVFTINEAGGETELVKKIQYYFSGEMLRLYSVGGSGTLRNIINGIEDFDRVEVAPCPMGLTNDFMKVFGNDQERFKNINNLIKGQAVPVDYIKTTGGVSLNTFSMGLDSNLVQKLETSRMFKIFGNKMPYLMAFIYSLFLSNPDEYEIIVGDEKFEGSFSQIIFGNGYVLGGAFVFSKKPLVNDGVAGVFISGNYQGFSLLPVVSALLKGDMSKLKKMAIVREASTFSIRRRDGGMLAMNFDGEMVYGIEKWDAQIVKCGLKLVLPKGVSLHE